MKTSRGIRFRSDDLRDIDEFLRNNPVFDFSSLARTAIRRFIEAPKIDLKPISNRSRSKASGRASQ